MYLHVDGPCRAEECRAPNNAINPWRFIISAGNNAVCACLVGSLCKTRQALRDDAKQTPKHHYWRKKTLTVRSAFLYWYTTTTAGQQQWVGWVAFLISLWRARCARIPIVVIQRFVRYFCLVSLAIWPSTARLIEGLLPTLQTGG